jgi:hypothetical protein
MSPCTKKQGVLEWGARRKDMNKQTGRKCNVVVHPGNHGDYYFYADADKIDKIALVEGCLRADMLFPTACLVAIDPRYEDEIVIKNIIEALGGEVAEK